MGYPLTLEEELKDPEYKNGVKAVLILRELKIGISSFVEVRCREVQEAILHTVLKKLSPHTKVPVCTECTRATLNSKKPCPENVCPFILEEIKKIHKSNRIELSCTDVSAWTNSSGYWEIARTFMGKEQEDKKSTEAADTDCTGLLSIIINCMPIHKYLTTDMVATPTVFNEVKKLRNKVMHSPDSRLSVALLQDLIKACVQILDDPKTLAADKTAKDARERIKEIEGMLLTVSNVDYQFLLEVQENQRREISEIKTNVAVLAGKQASQDKTMTDLAGKQAAQDTTISDLAGRQASQDKNMTDLAGKQAAQDTKQAAQDTKQAAQDTKISDLAGKQASEDKNMTVLAGKQAAQDTNISDLAGKQASHDKRISDLARQQALQGNELQVKRNSEERRQRKAKKRRIVAEKETVKRKCEEGGQWEAKKRRMSADEEAGAAELKADILKGYQKDLATVLETSLYDGVSAIHMFSPIIIREDLENHFCDNSPVRQGASAAAAAAAAYPISQHSGKVKHIESYRDIFFKDGQLQRHIVLLGEAGIGKTTFCNHIINLWCLVQTDDCQRDFTEHDQALIGVLKQFEYVFVVRCRDTKDQKSVLSMIKEMFCSGDDKIHIDNIFRYKIKQCLVIIDDLDEWLYTSSVGLHVFPDCTTIRGATILMTSRPWKVEAVPRNSLRDYRVLQLEGLDTICIYKLTQKFIKALEPSVTDHERLCINFFRQVKQQSMEVVVKQPLLLFSIIKTWLSRNHNLHRSLSMNYAGLINSVLSHSYTKLSDKDKTLAKRQEKESLPGCFTEMKTCLTHSSIIRKISALAFRTLVSKEKERSLVFTKEDLIDEVGEDCLDLCLKLGILSETKASSLAGVKHVTISFIHKSVQECFAALHMSEDESVDCLTEFTDKLTSLNEVFDLELILIFLFGMSPSKGQRVLKHVNGVVDQCPEIKAYRRQCEDYDITQSPVGKYISRLDQLYVRCAIELKHTVLSPTSQHTSIQPNVYIPDVLIDGNRPDDELNLMFCPGEPNIKSLVYTNYRTTPCHVVESLDSMTNLEKLVVVLSKDNLDRHIDLIIQSLPHLQQLQSFKIYISQERETYRLSVLQTKSLLTELGKLTNLVSVALSFLELATVEKVEFPTNLHSLFLSDMNVTSEIFACLPSSCTAVHFIVLKCTGDLVFPSPCTTLTCHEVSCTGDLVFPSTCTTLDCSDVSCTGDLVFPSTCSTLSCREVSYTGDLVFPSTCTTLTCHEVSCTGDLVFPSTCTTLDCSDVSCTGDLVFPSTCSTLDCSSVSCKGELVFPSTCTTLACTCVYYTGDLVFPSTCSTLYCDNVSCTGDLDFPFVCTTLYLIQMSLSDLAVLPANLTLLDINDVTLTQAAEEQLLRGLRSTSTLQTLCFCYKAWVPILLLHAQLDLRSCLSLHTITIDNIKLDNCGVVVPQNVRKIRMQRVLLSQLYWDRLVHNIYTCHNVRVSLVDVTINEATLKYIRQHFIVKYDAVQQGKSNWTEEEEHYITDGKNDITDEKNSNITDEENDRTDATNNDRTDEENIDRTSEKNNDRTDEENNDRTDEENDRTDATNNDGTDKTNNDKTDEVNSERTDEKDYNGTDDDNGCTRVKVVKLEFHIKCPEH